MPLLVPGRRLKNIPYNLRVSGDKPVSEACSLHLRVLSTMVLDKYIIWGRNGKFLFCTLKKISGKFETDTKKK